MKPFAARDHEPALADASGVVGHVPSLAADQARWAHEAASALMAAMPEMRCTVQPWPEHAGECYQGAQWCFQPGERRRAPTGASGETLAASLDEAEDLLDDVEAATGLAVEFDRHAPVTTALAAVCLSDTHGETVALLAPLAAPRPRRARGPDIVALSFAAARLPLAEAERLGPGDLVILQATGWQVDVAAERFTPTATLRFDPRIGVVAAGLAGDHALEEPDMSQPASPRDFTVPVMIGLPAIAVDRVKLDTLAQGGTLDIGAIAEGLRVSLSIGGRHLASGEIVTIGDRFAVLVAEPSPISSDERPRLEDNPDSLEKPDKEDLR